MGEDYVTPLLPSFSIRSLNRFIGTEVMRLRTLNCLVLLTSLQST